MRPKGKNIFVQVGSPVRATTISGIILPVHEDREKYAQSIARLHSVGDNASLIDCRGEQVQPGDTIAVAYLLFVQYRKDRFSNQTGYANMFEIDGQELWQGEEDMVYAVLRGEEWVAVNDYVIGRRFTHKKESSFLIVPEAYQDITPPNQMQYLSGDIEAGVGDTLLVLSKYMQPYSFPTGFDTTQQQTEYVVCRSRQVDAVIPKVPVYA